MTELTLEVIVGSVRDGRRGPLAADWILTQARRQDQFATGLIDLADAPLPLALPAVPPAMAEPERPDALTASTERLAAADAYIVVTPEYNHSFPASVKTFIDWHSRSWRAAVPSSARSGPTTRSPTGSSASTGCGTRSWANWT